MNALWRFTARALVVLLLAMPVGLAYTYTEHSLNRRHELAQQNAATAQANAAACSAIRTVNARIDAILSKTEAASLADPRVKGHPDIEARVRAYYASLPPAKNC